MGRKPLGDGPSTAAGRRELVLERAGELFAVNGVAATRMRDIAEAAGLLSGSLYYHFENKEAIVHELLRSALTNLVELYGKVRAENDDPRKCLRGLIQASFQIVATHRAASAMYLNDRVALTGQEGFGYLEETRSEIDALWLDVIESGVAAGYFRSDVDPRTFLQLSAYSIWVTASWPLSKEINVEELAEQFCAVLLDGFEVAQSRRRKASESS